MKTRIKAVVVDVRQLTLYREDGSSFNIPQSDPRVREIINEVMPIVQRGGVAEIDLQEVAAQNAYRAYEEKSSGFVRMFRVAKKTLGNLFASSEAEPADAVAAEVEEGKKAIYGNVPQTAIDEILSQAESVSSETYSEKDTTSDHTIVAVVEDNGQIAAIPGVENLKDQMAYAARMGSTVGVDAFMRRIAKVIGDRPHSIEDLLRFMQKGDLPIADDGCIIAYKILKRSTDGKAYVDCHTGKVRQQCGSYVVVDHSLVDMSRRNECSNGLHIARRGYIRGFGGDLVTLCKVRPEDVMTVPHGDPNKVRVCGYHILFELTQSAYRSLKMDQHATGEESARQLLNRAVKGNHAPPIEEVRITQQRGGGVITTQLDSRGIVSMGLRSRENFAAATKKTAKPASSGVNHQALDAGSEMDREEIKKIDQQARDTKTATPAPAPTPTPAPAPVKAKTKAPKAPKPSAGTKKQTVAEQARELFEAGKLTELMAFKKAKKKGWDVLGFSPAETEKILAANS